MANTKFSEIDEYGFKRDDSFDYQTYENVMQNYFTVLTRRGLKWERYLKTKPNLTDNKTAILKRYVRKGIPGPLRGDVWMKISGAARLQERSPGLYQSLLAREHEKSVVDIIKVDLPRTFPDNIFFNSISHQLYNVLCAYAHHNRDVGYCQGLNYIAGLLLIVAKNEEWTFWLLKILVEDTCPAYHTRTMSGLIRDIEVFKALIRERDGRIVDQLDRLGLPCAVVSTKWFVCLYAEVLPIETVLRIWDCIFNEGYKIVFRVSLTLMLENKEEILSIKDISTLADFFRNIVRGPVAVDCHEFMRKIFKVPGTLTRKRIEGLRADYTTTQLK